MFKSNLAYMIAFLFFAASCTNTDIKPAENAATDTFNIRVEKGYEPILRSAITVFDSIYVEDDIIAEYVPETEAVRALISKDAMLAVISRKLTDAELAPFKHRGFEPEQVCIAHDALAFIVHPSNIDTTLSTQTIEGIFDGSISDWSDINPKNTAGKIQVVFDNQNSGTVRYAIDSINGGNDLPANAFATKSNEEVINYIQKSKNSIGIISNNWISDTDDKGVQKFLESIGLVGISQTPDSEAFKLGCTIRGNFFP